MTREEFMDLLRYYFRNINQTQVNEILADYESHFEEGEAAGLSEEEIARELGSPKEIFEMYQDEGMIREKKSTTFMDVGRSKCTAPGESESCNTCHGQRV